MEQKIYPRKLRFYHFLARKLTKYLEFFKKRGILMLIFYKEGSSRADNVMKLVGVDLRGALTRTVPICEYPPPLGGLTTICVTVAPTKPLLHYPTPMFY